MYGLPQDFDPTGFVGQSIEMVSFTANTVHLAFDGDYSLTMESKFEHGHAGHEGKPVMFEVPVVNSYLMALIGKSVVAADVERPGTLCLRFDDGQSLRCIDDSEDYESYRINCSGTDIVV